MHLDPSDMRLGSLEIRIIAEDSDTKVRQELVLELTYTEIFLFEKKKRGYTELFTASLSGETISQAKELAKATLKTAVTEITAGVMFSRKYIGATDDDRPVALHYFHYESNEDTLKALIKIEYADNLTWEPALNFKLSSEDFWSAGLVLSMADHIDDIGTELGFPTNVRNKTLKITALRSV